MIRFLCTIFVFILYIYLFYHQIRRHSPPLTLRWGIWLYNLCVFSVPGFRCLEEYIWRNELYTANKSVYIYQLNATF